MIATMETNCNPSGICHLSSVKSERKLVKLHDEVVCSGVISSCANDLEQHRESVVMRSVAMSANIADAVKDEVKHLIRIKSSNSDVATVINKKLGYAYDFECMDEQTEIRDIKEEIVSINKVEGNIPTISHLSFSCSHILPSTEDNIILAMVLSKWDDIMGPQTVHAWLRQWHRVDVPYATSAVTEPSLMHGSANSRTGVVKVCTGPTTLDLASSGRKKSAEQATYHLESNEENLDLSKAIKYVTSHTVNYTGVNLLSCSKQSSTKRNAILFVVPELDLVSQALVFELCEEEPSVLYSLALLVSYRHYHYHTKLGNLCDQWLQRTVSRLEGLLLKNNDLKIDFGANDQVNSWMLNLCEMLFTLKFSGLTTLHVGYEETLVDHPLMSRALTSHLQTLGNTVVMGVTCEDINVFIVFLALFLDADEQLRSRLVLPSQKYTFQFGLFLQGLLLDEFGCRELCSMELSESRVPITAVDLTRGVHVSAVRQTPLHPAEVKSKDYPSQSDAAAIHQSILHPVKESASLVQTFLKGLKLLPVTHWRTSVYLFKRTLESLAYTLLSLISTLGSGDKLRCSLSLEKYLCQAMNLEEADLLIVVATAEKLKPGIHAYVVQSGASSR